MVEDILFGLFEQALNATSTGEFIPEAVGWVVVFIIARVVFKSIRNIRNAKRRAHQSTDERIFSQEQKRLGHARAGHQCEFSVGLSRCPRRSQHADHFFPFSRGGATSMQNFVAACEFHNLSKGAKMPSALDKSRIEIRRKNYFPALTEVRVGEWA